MKRNNKRFNEIRDELRLKRATRMWVEQNLKHWFPFLPA